MNLVSNFFSILLVASQVSSWTPDDEIIDDEVPSSNISKRKAIRNERYRWTNGVIPYKFDRSFFSSQTSLFKECLDQWMDVTCLVFREKQSGDKNYVQVKADNRGCRSAVGMVGRAQNLWLGRNCVWRTTILHEFGHAIGLHHEHQHPGRDNGITIDLSNVIGQAERWFETQSETYINTYNIKYDIDSVMHYNSKAFTQNSKRTMWAKNRLEQARLDNYWKTLSFSDAKIVNLMYKCSSKCGKVECPKEGFVDKNCRCVTPKSFFDEHCKDLLPEQKCLEHAFSGHCARNDREVIQGCRKTCDRCSMSMLPRKKHGDKTCFNEYYDDDKCAEWVKLGFCTENRSKEFMSQKCRLACNLCKDRGGSETGNGSSGGHVTKPDGSAGGGKVDVLKCPDKYDGCRKWAQDGYCKPSHELYTFVKTRCQGSCGFCEEKRALEVCADLDDTCYLMNKNGQCSDNAVVRTHCPRTCGLCG